MDHLAAVKAIAWSPHQHGLLASGGGTADRCIRFWNTLTSQPLQCMDTGSQVCNLAWSKHANELVSVQINTVHSSFASYTLWHTFMAIFVKRKLEWWFWSANSFDLVKCIDGELHNVSFELKCCFFFRWALMAIHRTRSWCGNIHLSLRLPNSQDTHTECSTWSVLYLMSVHSCCWTCC